MQKYVEENGTEEIMSILYHFLQLRVHTNLNVQG